MSTTARDVSSASRHVSMLRGQLLGALAIGWALGCAGQAEDSPIEDEPRANEPRPAPPAEGCPAGDAPVECYSQVTLDSVINGREAAGDTVPVTYTADGCPGPNVAVAASNAYYCGPSPAGEPVRRGDTCCYHHCNASPVCGRPFVVAGVASVADARPSLDWLRPAPPHPRGGGDAASAIAAEWLRDALAEHASVTSFSAFNLGLLALGAPEALVRASAAATLDEVFHAAACFELAREYGGRALGPAPLGMGQLRIETDLARLVESTFLEGCLGETAAALIARVSLDGCKDPRARAVLERIAEDEARHAELAWQFVAWALRRGGGDVARALSRALARATHGSAAAACRGADPTPIEWRRAGRLSSGERARLTEQTLRDIVQPMLAALRIDTPHRAGASAAGTV